MSREKVCVAVSSLLLFDHRLSVARKRNLLRASCSLLRYRIYAMMWTLWYHYNLIHKPHKIDFQVVASAYYLI